MSMLLDVVSVKAEADYGLVLLFENGEKRRFDMARYIDQKPWNKLKDSPLFFHPRVEHGTVAWPGEIDIDPETLYELSEPLELTPASVDNTGTIP